MARDEVLGPDRAGQAVELSLASAMASASSSNGSTVTTGPKISSVTCGRCAPASSTVGGEPVAGAGRRGSAEGDRRVVGHVRRHRCRSAPRETSGPISVVSCGRVADHHALDGRLEQFQEPVEDTALHQDAAARAAVLAGVVEHARPGAVAAARSRSESSKMMLALLPPSSSVTGLTCCGASGHHLLADLGRPGEHDLAHVGVGDEALADDRALAGQHLEQALGQPGLERRVRRAAIAVSGVHSAGFSSTALPAASAGAKPQDAIVIGKFHGTITPTTPSGSWKVTSSPPATGICLPISRSGRRRVVVQHVAHVAGLPAALPIGCPELRTSSAASSSTCASTTAANARSAAARSAGRQRRPRPLRDDRAGDRVVDGGDVELLDVGAATCLGRRVDDVGAAHGPTLSVAIAPRGLPPGLRTAAGRRGVSSGCHCTATTNGTPGSSTACDHAVGGVAR